MDPEILVAVSLRLPQADRRALTLHLEGVIVMAVLQYRLYKGPQFIGGGAIIIGPAGGGGS